MKYLILSSLLFVTAANSATYYIDYATGADGNNGTSTSTPWQHAPGDSNATSVAAGTTLAAGDVVNFKRGITYAGSITCGDDGDVKSTGTNATITSLGVVLTSVGSTFISDGVVIGDKVYVNGEGLSSVLIVNSETVITLDTPTLHYNLTGVDFAIVDPITYTIAPTWGSGSALITGGIVTSNRSGLLWEGVVSRGIEVVRDSVGISVQCNGGSVGQALWFRKMYVHDAVGGDNAAFFLRNVDYALIDSCEIDNIGDNDSQSGDDGINCSTRALYTTLQNNSITNIGDDGIHLAPMDQGYVQFNTISNAWSIGAHSDGIAMNSSTLFECTVRYNEIVDCSSPSDIENVNFHFYYNYVHDTDPNDSKGNIGWRYKKAAFGEVENNIFAYNVLPGVKAYSTAGSPNIIRNNIFWENQSGGNGGQSIEYGAVTSGSILDYNIYRRREFPASNGVIVSWDGQKTLAQLKAVGAELNGFYITDTTTFFVDETRATFDPHQPDQLGPQWATGYNNSLMLDFDGVAVPVGSPSIGAYEFLFSPPTPPDPIDTPAMSPVGKDFIESQNISITTQTNGTSIYYTDDGVPPTVSSTLYGGPVAVSDTTTLKAFAIKTGHTDSEIASETYNFGPFDVTDSYGNVGYTERSADFALRFTSGVVSTSDNIEFSLSENAITTNSFNHVWFKFSDTGAIQAYNTNAWTADNVITYNTNDTYQFDVMVDWSEQQFDLVVTPSSSTNIVIADGYGFQAIESIASFGNFSRIADAASLGTVSNVSFVDPDFVVTPTPPEPPTPTAPAAPTLLRVTP